MIFRERSCTAWATCYTVSMEAKRGPSSGEKAGNANVVPATPTEESSSSTKKNSASRPASPEATQDIAAEPKSSLFFERPDDPKNNANKVDRAGLFSDEKDTEHETAEKPTVDTEQTEEATDHEAEPLTSEQELQVVEEYTRDRLEVVDTELAAAEKNSADAFIARADKVLLEHITQAVHERTTGSVSSDEILDSAAVKAEEALHMTHDAEHEDASHEMSEAERDSLIDSILHGTDDSESLVETYDLEESAPDTTDYEPVTPAALPHAGGAMGGGPTGPTPPEYAPGEYDDSSDHTAYTHAVGDGSVSSGGVAGSGSSATRAESVSPIQPEAQRRHDFNNGLLIGGVLGYVVGRHHGRKKAERALKPELARHKKEVDALQQKIIAREQHIRSLAANKVIAQQVETHTQLDSHKEEFGKATLTSTETAPTPNPTLSAELVGAAAVAIGRPTAAEAAQPESVLLAAQTRNSTVEQAPVKQHVTAETPTPQVSPEQNRIEPRPKLASKDVAQLPQNELENVAETIPIKGQTLRKIYESGQVDKEGLRRIVTEYVRTGKVERLVDAEIAAAKFRKRSPELLRGGGTATTTAMAGGDTQVSAITHITTTAQEASSTTATDRPTHADNPNGELSERALNGKVVIVAAVILAVVIILLVSRRR